MQTIIDLWYGNTAPFEHCGAHNSEILHVYGLIERNREALRTGLTDVQKDLFQKYIDCSDEYLISMLELAFFDGFSLSAKITTEALSYRAK